jgi:predicted RNase H-like HicB family nuclease
LKYTAILTRGEDGWIVAEVPALPGCVSQGRTREEAIANIADAVAGYLDSLRKDGEPVPEEDSVQIQVAA